MMLRQPAAVATEEEMTFLKDVLLVYCAEAGHPDRADLIRQLYELEFDCLDKAGALTALRNRLMNKASGLSVVAAAKS